MHLPGHDCSQSNMIDQPSTSHYLCVSQIRQGIHCFLVDFVSLEKMEWKKDREREIYRERDLYIYRDRERVRYYKQRERETERERERERKKKKEKHYFWEAFVLEILPCPTQKSLLGRWHYTSWRYRWFAAITCTLFGFEPLFPLQKLQETAANTAARPAMTVHVPLKWEWRWEKFQRTVFVILLESRTSMNIQLWCVF